MVVSRSLIFLIVAVVCFAVALLIAVSIVAGSNHTAWQDAGLLALAASFLP